MMTSAFNKYFMGRVCLALRVLLLTAGVLLAAPAVADASHDHDETPAAAAGLASPRIRAASNLFELTGIYGNGQMTVYLDRFSTNEPVTDARMEFASGATKGIAAPQADGTYRIKFDGFAKPGVIPMAFTVTAGKDRDLLAGELTINDAHPHDEVAQPGLRWSGYALALFVVLSLAVLLARKRFPRFRRFPRFPKLHG